MIMLDLVAVACDAGLTAEEDSQMGTDWNINMDTGTNMEVDADSAAWTSMTNNYAGDDADCSAQEPPAAGEQDNVTLSGIQLQIYSVLEAVGRGELSPGDAARHLDALEALGESDAGQQNEDQDTSTD